MRLLRLRCVQPCESADSGVTLFRDSQQLEETLVVCFCQCVARHKAPHHSRQKCQRSADLPVVSLRTKSIPQSYTCKPELCVNVRAKSPFTGVSNRYQPDSLWNQSQNPSGSHSWWDRAYVIFNPNVILQVEPHS